MCGRTFEQQPTPIVRTPAGEIMHYFCANATSRAPPLKHSWWTRTRTVMELPLVSAHRICVLLPPNNFIRHKNYCYYEYSVRICCFSPYFLSYILLSVLKWLSAFSSTQNGHSVIYRFSRSTHACAYLWNIYECGNAVMVREFTFSLSSFGKLLSFKMMLIYYRFCSCI